MTWEITQESVDNLRDWLTRSREPGLAVQAHRSDDDLRRALEGAVEWIGGKRYSFTIVAANYLRDGNFHA
jgi:hypothetical protein